VLWWWAYPSLTNNTIHTNYRFTIIPLLFFLTVASAHITDYSKAIPIVDGRILVWEEFAFVRHSANLSEYRRVVEETDGMTDRFPQSHMQKLLSVDTANLRDLLESLSIHHRVARSLDFLGKALKVVAERRTPRILKKLNSTNFYSLMQTIGN